MKQICFLLVFLLTLNVVSQNSNEEFHIVELLPNDTESVEQTNFYISEVIDNRLYQDNIGIAQKGVFNKKVPSTFSKNFDTEIIDYLQTIFPKDDSKKALTLRINQLLITENTGAFKETGIALVTLDVLSKVNDSTYLNLGSYSSWREKNSADVTRKHDDRIRGVLKDCLMEYGAAGISIETAKPITLTRPESPNILSELPETGFFNSFSELYNNVASSDSTYVLDTKKSDADRLHFRNSAGKHPMYFAYYDGTNFYINASNYSADKYLVKAEIIDRYFFFNDVFINQEKVTGMSIAFGMLGVLASNERNNVLLDLHNGKFTIVDSRKIRNLIKDNYPDLYKDYKRNTRDYDVMKRILKELFSKEDPSYIRNLLVD